MRLPAIVALGIAVGVVCSVISVGRRTHLPFPAHSGSSVATERPMTKAVAPPAAKVVENQVGAKAERPAGTDKKEPGSTPLAASESKYPAWSISGRWRTTREEAYQSALQMAGDQLSDYLHGQNPPTAWPVSADNETFRELVRKLVKNDQDHIDNFKEAGDMHQVSLELRLTPAARAEIYQQDRAFRAMDRMTWLARLLAAIVAVLAVTAGYLRMEDLTKGYYTGWLRLAAASAIAGAAVVLLLFA